MALCLLTGCGTAGAAPIVYEASFLTLFDTVTIIKGTADSKENFETVARRIYGELERYHRLFDIYHEYSGINNLKTVNDHAGIAPVKVDGEVIELLQDCKHYYALTDGRTNVAMGGVLQLWHQARTQALHDPAHARVPDMAALQAAGEHMSMDTILIDGVNGTVFITDPHVRLDVGAVAKGWAVQRVAETVDEALLISVGGNVCATGTKYDGQPWVVGLQDPGGGQDYLHTLYVSGGSIVTSGDYQRTYTVDGKAYHHIIHPNTLMPPDYWRSVTVVCDDSGLADALSTALFLLPLQEGRALAERVQAEVLWIDGEGQEFTTPQFRKIIRS